MNQRPDVTDEDIGMRAFQLRKAKAVERAIERVRHGLGTGWGHLTEHEIEEIEWALGELWAYVARTEWDDLRFGHLTLEDLKKILEHAREMRGHTRNAVDALTDIHKIVAAKA